MSAALKRSVFVSVNVSVTVVPAPVTDEPAVDDEIAPKGIATQVFPGPVTWAVDSNSVTEAAIYFCALGA